MANPAPVEVRFREKHHTNPDSDCWIWHGGKDASGYGRFQDKGKVYPAHRVSWLLAAGLPIDFDIGEGMQIDHLCGVHFCVNPDHLERVTQQENLKRRIFIPRP